MAKKNRPKEPERKPAEEPPEKARGEPEKAGGEPKKARREPEKAGEPERREQETGEKAVNWDAIHQEYITGNTTYAKLAEKYQISVSTLSKKATKDGWKNDRKKVGEKVAKKMATRAARAREEKALKGIQLTKYIADLWTDNLKALNELIRETPEHMLNSPNFAAGIPRGLKETYELIMEMNGRGYMNRKLANEERKLKLEREKFELEKQKWQAQMAALERGTSSGREESWQVIEDTEEVDSIGG